MAAGRRALVVATYAYADSGLSRLAAPAHDAESFASVLQDPAIAGFDVTMLVDQPHHVVGEAIADFYGGARRDDLTLLYFTGHGVKDDEGRLYLAMNNTRREALMFTAISAAQLNDAMDASTSRRKVLILDCCYSGAFPAGRTPKSDEGVHTLERFQGKGRAVLTASDATQYAFEGDDVSGSGTSSVFTRHLVEAISSGAADLDDDGDIALDELYSYVYERVVAELPQQRPKKQEDVDGRILLARNVHWTLPSHLRHAIASPIAGQRLEALQQLEHLHAAGNDIVRAAVTEQVVALAEDDSRSVSSAAEALLRRIGSGAAVAPAEETAAPQAGTQAPPPPASPPPPVARARGDAGTGGPGAAASGVPPGAPSRPQWPSVRVLLALIALAGALLLLARSLIFESTSDQRAADVGVPWWLWLIGAGLPLLVAAQLLLLRGTELWTLAVAGGLVAGAALSQLEMVLGSAAWSMDADTDEQPGPGWWVQLGGAVVLIACVVLVLRSPGFRGRPGPRSDWRAVAALLMVIAALVARLDAYRDFWVLLAGIEPALLLAAACLPLVVLDLSPAQRWFGLVAVTVLGMWVVATPVRELVTDSLPVDTRTAVVSVIAGLGSVAACWLAQWRPPRRRARPEGALAESR